MFDARFSLRWLFGVVSFAAVSCGLLIYARPILVSVTLSTVLVVLLTAITAAISNSGDRRAFWTGFALFGFAYIWLIFGNWQMPNGSDHPRNHLLSTTVLTWLYSIAPATQTTTTMVQSPGAMPGMGMSGPMMPASMGGGMMPGAGSGMAMTTVAMPPDWNAFMTTGHSLFALAFACVGGLIAGSCFRRRKPG